MRKRHRQVRQFLPAFGRRCQIETVKSFGGLPCGLAPGHVYLAAQQGCRSIGKWQWQRRQFFNLYFLFGSIPLQQLHGRLYPLLVLSAYTDYTFVGCDAGTVA